MTNKILVTGGFGFIGGHLVEHLLKTADNQVHVVDDLSSNPIPVEKLLAELGSLENLTYDICTVNKFYKDNPLPHFDEIYHLASPVGPAGVLKYAGRMIKAIVDDTYDVMAMSLSSGAKLVDVSTSEVYGGGQGGYCSEELPKIVPAQTTVRLEYAVGKLASETAIINTAKVTNLNASIVRPFNISGPRQSGQGGFVLPRFVALAAMGKPLTVFGNGNQVRAFTHVKDIVDGIVKVMALGVSGEAYNIGNPENKTSILELARSVTNIVNSNSEIVFVEPKEIYGPLFEDANDKFPNANKAITQLSWNPCYSIEDTIRDTFNYMKSVDSDLFQQLAGNTNIRTTPAVSPRVG